MSNKPKKKSILNYLYKDEEDEVSPEIIYRNIFIIAFSLVFFFFGTIVYFE